MDEQDCNGTTDMLIAVQMKDSAMVAKPLKMGATALVY
jgi:hypothetical protein